MTRDVPIFVVGAAALAAALLCSCSSGPGEAEVQKRTSYFEVVGVFEAPGKGLADMAYAKGNIWLADEEGAGLVYRIDPANGRVLSSAATAYGPPTALCTDGTYLYAADGADGGVHRYAPTPRLDELASFSTGLADIRGMYFYGGTFYVYDGATGGVYEFDVSWTPGRSWRAGAEDETIRGFERAAGRVWSADWRNGWLNRHRKTNFDVDRKFCTPGWHPAGLAWDGAYLFLGDSGARKVYKLDISTAP
jgi:DNA-binding beta-propeller fold protein YncE